MIDLNIFDCDFDVEAQSFGFDLVNLTSSRYQIFQLNSIPRSSTINNSTMPPIPQPQGHPAGQSVWNKRKIVDIPLTLSTYTNVVLQSRWEL